MVSFFGKALVGLLSVSAASARLSYNYPSTLEEVVHRRLADKAGWQDSNGNGDQPLHSTYRTVQGCHMCDCFVCDSVTDNGDDTLTVKIAHCKGGDISWMCCVGLDGEQGNCELDSCSGNQVGAKCEGVSTQAGLNIRIPKDTTTFMINTHDGKTSGTGHMANAVCGGNGDQNSSCKEGTAHCLLEFEVANCGAQQTGTEITADADDLTTPATDPEPEPAADPEPEPAADPEPEPAADPEPEPAADPEPEPAADPEPEPEAEETRAETQPTDGGDPPAPDAPSPADQTTDQAFTKGDPHFKTFGGELYDFHGECDLVLLHNPDFKEGLGMDVHIRTKIEAFWSSVESAVLKLGDETLEIKADPESKAWLWHNKKDVTSNLEDNEWSVLRLAGFKVRFKSSGPNTREAVIYLKDGYDEVMTMKSFKSFLRVDINWKGSDNYNNSVGLLGSHAHNGKRLGRHGKFIQSYNKFGQDWQVKPKQDGELFHSYEGAVVGKKCKMPPKYHKGDDLSAAALRGRRLGASALDEEAAEKACNHLVDPEEKKACVYDVVATQDLGMASTW